MIGEEGRDRHRDRDENRDRDKGKDKDRDPRHRQRQTQRKRARERERERERSLRIAERRKACIPPRAASGKRCGAARLHGQIACAAALRGDKGALRG